MATKRPLTQGPVVLGKTSKLKALADADSIGVGPAQGLADNRGTLIARQADTAGAPVRVDGVDAWPPAKLPAQPTPAAGDRIPIQEAAGALGKHTTVSALAAPLLPLDASRVLTATPRVVQSGETAYLAKSSREALRGLGVRGPMVGIDFPAQTRRVLGSWNGRCRMGYQPGVVPEDVDILWRTEVRGTYTTMNGTVTVGQTLTGLSTGWTGKLIELDVGLKTFTVSLWTGTGAAEDLQASVGNNLAGITLTFGAGSTAGYTNTLGQKVQRRANAGPVYNTIGAQSSQTFLNPTLGTQQPPCWPKIPEYQNQTFWIPPGRVVKGNALVLMLSGWTENTLPVRGSYTTLAGSFTVGDFVEGRDTRWRGKLVEYDSGLQTFGIQVIAGTPVATDPIIKTHSPGDMLSGSPNLVLSDIPELSIVLGLGQNLFALTNMSQGSTLLTNQLEFLSGALPTMIASGREPFDVVIRCESHRNEDRTQGQVWTADFRWGSGYAAPVHRRILRGLDNPTSPTVLIGHDYQSQGLRLAIRGTMLPFVPASGVVRGEFRQALLTTDF